MIVTKNGDIISTLAHAHPSHMFNAIAMTKTKLSSDFFVYLWYLLTYEKKKEEADQRPDRIQYLCGALITVMFFCHFWNSIRSENNCESQYCVCERAHYDKFILCVAFVLKQNANAIHENEKVKYVMIEKHAHSIFGMRYIFNNNIMSATQL